MRMISRFYTGVFPGSTFAAGIVLLFISCAQLGSPTGGVKDTTPPKIVKSVPLNFSTGFQGNSITLVFDEFVQLKDLGNQLIISPPFIKKPEVRIKRKSVIMEFTEKLIDSTTYTFNFGNAIVDLNEGNPLDSNIFVFSTGSFLDSLSVSGFVNNSADAKPEKEIAVMLYPNLEDSVPYKEQPLYIARTKDDGSYSLNNIKAGDYRIFALKDMNNNFRFDQPTERIAFFNDIVHLDTSLTINLNAFEEEQKKQYVKKAYAEQYGKLTFEFNKPVDSLSIFPINTSFKKAWFIEESSGERDTISYWLTDIGELDSLHLVVNDYKTIKDTFEIAIGKKEITNKTLKKTKSSPLKLLADFNSGKNNLLDLNQNLTVTFSHPIAGYDFSAAVLSRGEDTLRFETRIKDPASRVFEIIHPFEEDSSYQLLIPEGAFLDIFNLKNDTIVNKFKIKRADSYGVIALQLNVPDKGHQFILELNKEKLKTYRRKIINHNETISFTHLDPGDYYLKITYDENNNGKWDTGNYLEKKQPEKILFYSGAITVRANWDMDLEWIIEGEEKEK